MSSFNDTPLCDLRVQRRIPEITSRQLCARCGEEIALANTLDQYREVDRHEHTVSGRKLSKVQWAMFSLLLLRRGLPVDRCDLEEYVFEKEVSYHNRRTYVWDLRRLLVGTGFRIVTIFNDGVATYKMEL